MKSLQKNDLQRFGRIKYHLKMSGLLKSQDVQAGAKCAHWLGGGAELDALSNGDKNKLSASLSIIKSLSLKACVCTQSLRSPHVLIWGKSWISLSYKIIPLPLP